MRRLFLIFNGRFSDTQMDIRKSTDWKSRLKQLIKDSRQTQVEVARSMANMLENYEQTTVSENAFVAPLSRFVNAKGNEIDRWFEQKSLDWVHCQQRCDCHLTIRWFDCVKRFCLGRESTLFILYFQ